MAIDHWLAKPIPLPNAVLLAGAGLLASLSGLLGSFWWAFDLAAHFVLHLGVGLALLSPWVWRSRWQRLAILCLLVAVVQLGRALHWPASTAPEQTATPTLKVLLLNVLRNNHEHAAVLSLIEAHNPDLVVLLEINQHWAISLRPLHRAYPHRLVESAEDNFGIGLYSRLPLEPLALRHPGPWRLASIFATLRLGEQRLSLYATHPPPPMNATMSAVQATQLREIAAELAAIPGPRVLLGDLNTTPWSAHFRPLREVGLHPSVPSLSYQGSWPAWLGRWGIPLDQVLVSAEIVVLERQLGAAVGSDHLPVVVTLGLSPPSAAPSSPTGGMPEFLAPAQ